MKPVDVDKGIRVTCMGQSGTCLSESALGQTDVLFDNGKEYCAWTSTLQPEFTKE